MDPNRLKFGWVDYSLSCALISVSLVIGIYFGFFNKQKQSSTKEYLFGGKTMGYVPVAASMIAGHVSGITLLGVPAEVYQFGSQYFVVVLSLIASGILTAYIFLPVFYKLQLPSTYEYLEIRFSRSVRTFSSFLYILSLMTYIPIVVYVPALAVAQVTGFSLHLITPVLCIVCIFYTSIGGIKAVIWTDTVQIAFTLGGLVSVFIIGVSSVGGISEVWRIAAEGNRTTIFNMDPSPFTRNTFWGFSIGTMVLFLTHSGVSQNCVQRFLSIPKEADVVKAIILMTIGMIAMKLVSAFTGLVMYSRYKDCDPLQANIIKRSDQAVPYYVMDVAGHISGLPGLFIAGLVSCALSTMSSCLNTLAGSIYDDFIDRWISRSASKDARAANIMKVIVVIVGIISTGMVFVIERLGTVFEMAMSIRSVVEGPLLGLFILGMCVPWVGKKGAIYGGWTSMIIMGWLVGGTQWHVYNKRIRSSPLPMSVDHCPYPLNATLTERTELPPLSPEEEPWFIFRISMMYFTLIGTLIVIIVGILSSWVTREIDTSAVNPDYITPIMRRFLSRKKYAAVPLQHAPEKHIFNNNM